MSIPTFTSMISYVFPQTSDLDDLIRLATTPAAGRHVSCEQGEMDGVRIGSSESRAMATRLVAEGLRPRIMLLAEALQNNPGVIQAVDGRHRCVVVKLGESHGNHFAICVTTNDDVEGFGEVRGWHPFMGGRPSVWQVAYARESGRLDLHDGDCVISIVSDGREGEPFIRMDAMSARCYFDEYDTSEEEWEDHDREMVRDAMTDGLVPMHVLDAYADGTIRMTPCAYADWMEEIGDYASMYLRTFVCGYDTFEHHIIDGMFRHLCATDEDGEELDGDDATDTDKLLLRKSSMRFVAPWWYDGGALVPIVIEQMLLSGIDGIDYETGDVLTPTEARHVKEWAQDLRLAYRSEYSTEGDPGYEGAFADSTLMMLDMADETALEPLARRWYETIESAWYADDNLRTERDKKRIKDMAQKNDNGDDARSDTIESASNQQVTIDVDYGHEVDGYDCDYDYDNADDDDGDEDGEYIVSKPDVTEVTQLTWDTTPNDDNADVDVDGASMEQLMSDEYIETLRRMNVGDIDEHVICNDTVCNDNVTIVKNGVSDDATVTNQIAHPRLSGMLTQLELSLCDGTDAIDTVAITSDEEMGLLNRCLTMLQHVDNDDSITCGLNAMFDIAYLARADKSGYVTMHPTVAKWHERLARAYARDSLEARGLLKRR